MRHAFRPSSPSQGVEGEFLMNGFSNRWRWPKSVATLMQPYLAYCNVIGSNLRMRELKTGFKLDPIFLEFLKDKPNLKKRFGIQKIVDSVKWTRKEESIDIQELPYVPAAMNLLASYQGLVKSCRTYNVPPGVDLELWAISKAWMFDEFLPLMCNSRVLSLDEVLAKMDLSKSPGRCFVGRWKTKGEMIADPEGRNVLNTYWDNCGYLGLSFCLFGCDSKDELRPFEKVVANKTRLFWSAPATHHFNGARLLSDAQDKLRDRRDLSCHTIGMSRFGREWNNVMSQFLGCSVMDMDGSNWDTNFFGDALWDVCELYWESLDPVYRTEENRNRMINYFGEAIESYGMMPDGIVVQVFGGMKSGVICTASANTMHHFRQHCYVWLKLKNSANTGDNFREFRRQYKLAIMGDDCLNSPPKEPEFTYESVKTQLDLFLPHSSSKPRFVDILEAVYCSQRNIMLNGRILPVPDPYRCFSSLLIGGKRLDPDVAASRCLMIRIHAYWDPEMRSICEEYYNFILDFYRVHLQDKVWQDVKAQYLSHQAIWKLYTSWECDSSTYEFFNSLNNLICCSEISNDYLESLSVISRLASKEYTGEKDPMDTYVPLQQRPPRLNRRGGRKTKRNKETSNLRKIQSEPVAQPVKNSREIQSVNDHNLSLQGANRNKTRRVRVGTLKGRQQIYSETREFARNARPPRPARSNELTLWSPSSPLYSRKKFLQTVLNPEKTGGCQYPDEFLGKTSCFNSILDFQIPFLLGPAGNLTNGYGVNFPPGCSMVSAYPSFAMPLQYLAEFGATPGFNYEIMLTQQSFNGQVGLRKRTDDFDGVSEATTVMTLDQVNVLNIVGVMSRSNLDPAPKILPWKNVDPTGLFFFGYSLNLTGGSFSLNLVTDFNGAGTATGGLTLYVITTSGVTPIVGNLVIGISSINVPAGSGVILGDYRGDNMVGFALGLNPVLNAPSNINILSVRLQFTMALGSPQLNWLNMNFPGFNSAEEIYTRYRVVAMSMWSKNTYPEAYAGGVTAGRLQSGMPFLYDGSNQTGFMWNYSGISQADNSYSGAYKDGLYSFWVPMTESDIAMRPVNEPSWFIRPHIIHIMNLQPITTGGAVTDLSGNRVRLVITYECQSSYSYIMKFPSPVDLEAIQMIKRMIDNKEIPTTMENSFHEWLLDVTRGIVSTMETYGPLVARAIQAGAPIIKAILAA